MKIRSLFLLSFGLFQANAQDLSVLKAEGWFESLYAEWSPIAEATQYEVSVIDSQGSATALDPQLVRAYANSIRVDALGLSAGTYSLEIKALNNGTEIATKTISDLQVDAHDRAGFAFSNGRVPGAYQLDGTPKSGARVLYVNEINKNDITLDVTGACEEPTPCVGLQPILDGFKKGAETRPLIVRLIGQVTDLATMYNGDIVVETKNSDNSYITIEGVGEDATADGWGIRLKNAANIEVRNIGIMNVNSGEGDNLGLQQNNQYVWVHHIDFFYGDAGSDSDQAKGDGALDCKKSTYVTFSYNHFWDTGKSNLLGLSEGTTDGLFITYHHNWYDHSDSRHPRVRFYSAHVYNNYYDGIAKYGIGSTKGSSVFAEGNYFRNAKYPILTSMQGSDVWDESAGSNDYSDMPTFSKEDGGTIKAFNNYIEGGKRFVAYGDQNFSNSTVDFDAYVTATREETIPSSVTSVYGSNTYNNFDTNPSVMYAYDVDSPEEAKAKVMQYAGRMNGGDFSFTFNNSVDDASYAVNTELKNALVTYQTTLLSIQDAENGLGTIIPVEPTDPTDPTDPTEPTDPTDPTDPVDPVDPIVIEGDVVHNFTTQGTTSELFQITGNLSTSKGSITVNGEELTQCLKMESATEIDFNLSLKSSITLLFNSDFTGEVNIDGVAQMVTTGQLTLSLEAGAHKITKGNTANLFYISLAQEETAEPGEDITLQNPSTAIFDLEYHLAGKQLHLQSSTPILEVQVLNTQGALILRDLSGTGLLSLENLNSGLYLLRVRQSNSIQHFNLPLK